MSAIFHTLKNMLDLFLDEADTPFSFSDEQAELLQQLFTADASMSLAPLYEPRAYPGYMSALAKFSPLCAYQQIALDFLLSNLVLR
ncbi:hypothetical protein CEP51_000561 [Fusarium floridanum]|uniref:Uncharacterized protein n=1 Tax=Fusarium floridanum TaxID=1325733 RepID=A0A428SLW3_9HYPO|nr:hypothetical protein CEP51_000561 [Fusarium floridanum]